MEYVNNFRAPLHMVVEPRTDGVEGQMIQMKPWTAWILSNQDKFRAHMRITPWVGQDRVDFIYKNQTIRTRNCRLSPNFLFEFLVLKYEQPSYKLAAASFLHDFKFCMAVSEVLFPDEDVVKKYTLATHTRVLVTGAGLHDIPFSIRHVWNLRVDQLKNNRQMAEYTQLVKKMIRRLCFSKLLPVSDLLYEYTLSLLGRTPWRRDKDTNTKLMMFLLEKFIKRNEYDRLKISVNVFLQHLEINGCYMKKRNGPPAWLRWEGKWTDSRTEQLLIDKLENPRDFFCLFLKHGLVEEAAMLLRGNMDICSVSHYMYCAKYGNVDMLQYIERRIVGCLRTTTACRVLDMYENDSDDVFQPDEHPCRYNAFFYAVCGLNVEVVKYLVNEKKCAYSMVHIFEAATAEPSVTQSLGEYLRGNQYHKFVTLQSVKGGGVKYQRGGRFDGICRNRFRKIWEWVAKVEAATK